MAAMRAGCSFLPPIAASLPGVRPSGGNDGSNKGRLSMARFIKVITGDKHEMFVNPDAILNITP